VPGDLDRRLVRTATGAAAASLRREAVVLQRARHPGVVELIEANEGDGGVTVVTATPPGRLLADTTLGLDELAAVIAILSTTVADLHDVGVVHGAINDRHVLVGDDGRPILIGFESAEILDGPERRWLESSFVSSDVGALVALAGPLFRAEPIRSRRGRRRQGLVASTGEPRTARHLAAAMLHTAPAARLPGTVTPEALSDAAANTWCPASAMATRRRLSAVAPLGALALAAAGLAALQLAPNRSPGRPRLATVPSAVGRDPGAAALARAAGGLTDSSAGPSTRPASVQVAARSPEPPEPPATTSLTYAGGVLQFGDSRFQVGEPGDVLSLGRWTCNGAQTLILARPDTGQVWLFVGWPSAGEPIVARQIGSVPRVSTLRAQPDGACDDVVVGRDVGPSVVLDPRAAR
jgi:hypothetical protein